MFDFYFLLCANDMYLNLEIFSIIIFVHLYRDDFILHNNIIRVKIDRNLCEHMTNVD
jgi:hypothetical protein